MGYKLKYHRVRRKGHSPAAYSLVSILAPIYLKNTLYSNEWLESHCESFDLYMNRPIGTEFALLSKVRPSCRSAPLIPDELGMWARIAVFMVKHYVLVRWDSKLKACLKEFRYCEAVELLKSSPPWRNINHERQLVARDLAGWISFLILENYFYDAKSYLSWYCDSLPIVIEEPVLIELKVRYISRVKAARRFF